MARKPNTQNLLKLSPIDVNKMNEQELRQAVSILASTANKRLKRLSNKQMGTSSPAYQSAQKRAYQGSAGGKFGTKGKNRNQLLNEFKAIKNFLESKTSTVTGWTKYRADVAQKIGGSFTSEEQEKEFWRNYRKLDELHPEMKQQAYGSTATQSDLRKVMQEKSAPELLREINRERVSKNRKNREAYIENLSQKGYYLNENHRRVKVDFTDSEDVIQLMSMKLNLEYEKHQQQFVPDERDFNSI